MYWCVYAMKYFQINNLLVKKKMKIEKPNYIWQLKCVSASKWIEFIYRIIDVYGGLAIIILQPICQHFVL